MESLLSTSNDSGILFSYWTPIYGIGTIIILLLNKNQIVSKEMLINKIWGYDSNAEYNYVEVYASFLRKKL